jgi:DNA-binding LacI/PurR family transcriptional regulator
MGQERVTIRRISELAGLSKSTVARVLNAHPSVSPDAIRRVEQIVAQSNYKHRPRRPRHPQKLSVAKSEKTLAAFALVVPDIRTPFYASLIQGFDAGAAKVGHQVITCNSENDLGKQADIVLQLMHKNVAGVALNPTSDTPPPVHQIQRLQTSGIPVVLLHRGITGVSAPLIRLPYGSVTSLVAQKLLECGHRRLALFLTDRTAGTRVYEQEFRAALDRLSGGHSQQLLVHYGKSPTPSEFIEYEENATSALQEMLRLPPAERPTGIFTPWDPSAELIYLLLTQWNYRVPEDYSLVSEGDSWRAGALNRRMSSVTLDESQTGRLAARLLDEMCSGDRSIGDSEEFTIPVGWHGGETIGPAAS